MITVIITSWKEPNTIGKAIQSVGDTSYSGIPADFEIIQVSPDDATLIAGNNAAKQLKLGEKFIQIRDPQKGKPYAYKMAIDIAKGDIIITTDGDVYFGKNAVAHIVKEFDDNNIGGVSGRPISAQDKSNFWSYIGNLLADSAHHKRKNTVAKKEFFPMSGYIMAFKKIKLAIPQDVLSDDAYISYIIAKGSKLIGYAPEALAYIKYPNNYKDYMKQKVRSHGGYQQLKKYPEIQGMKTTRTLLDELKYFWFPIAYANNFREFIWSLLLYPLRLIQWIRIFYERVVLKKGMSPTGWARIESTK